VESAYKNIDFEKTFKDNLNRVNVFISEQVVPVAKDTMNSLTEMYNKAVTNSTSSTGSDSTNKKKRPDVKPHNEFYEYLVV
jgi:hypothetical protein